MIIDVGNADVVETSTTTALAARAADPVRDAHHHGEPAHHTHDTSTDTLTTDKPTTDTFTDNWRTFTGAATDSFTGDAAAMSSLDAEGLGKRAADPLRNANHHGEPVHHTHTHDTETDNWRTYTGAATDSFTGNAAAMSSLDAEGLGKRAISEATSDAADFMSALSASAESIVSSLQARAAEATTTDWRSLVSSVLGASASFVEPTATVKARGLWNKIKGAYHTAEEGVKGAAHTAESKIVTFVEREAAPIDDGREDYDPAATVEARGLWDKVKGAYHTAEEGVKGAAHIAESKIVTFVERDEPTATLEDRGLWDKIKGAYHTAEQGVKGAYHTAESKAVTFVEREAAPTDADNNDQLHPSDAGSLTRHSVPAEATSTATYNGEEDYDFGQHLYARDTGLDSLWSSYTDQQATATASATVAAPAEHSFQFRESGEVDDDESDIAALAARELHDVVDGFHSWTAVHFTAYAKPSPAPARKRNADATDSEEVADAEADKDGDLHIGEVHGEKISANDPGLFRRYLSWSSVLENNLAPTAFVPRAVGDDLLDDEDEDDFELDLVKRDPIAERFEFQEPEGSEDGAEDEEEGMKVYPRDLEAEAAEEAKATEEWWARVKREAAAPNGEEEPKILPRDLEAEAAEEAKATEEWWAKVKRDAAAAPDKKPKPKHKPSNAQPSKPKPSDPTPTTPDPPAVTCTDYPDGTSTCCEPDEHGVLQCGQLQEHCGDNPDGTQDCY